MPERVPSSPRRQCRPGCQYLRPYDWADLAVLICHTLFEIALRLTDFSPLPDFLAQGPSALTL